MADNDDFDPNDLESIDALLDEAELEAVEDDSEDNEDALAESDDLPEQDDLEDIEASANQEQNTNEAAVQETPNEQAQAPTDTDDSEDLLDSLDDLEDLADTSETDEEALSNEETTPPEQANKDNASEEDAPEIEGDTAPQAGKQNKQALQNNATEQEPDDFLKKRAQAQTAQKSNLTADDMDSIKKLIIIFGSVLSVLVLTAIGIGVWGALSASSAGISEETQTLIETVKVNSEQTLASSTDNAELNASLEKKVDAINFQIEQLVADIADMQAGEPSPIDPLGLNTAKNDTANKPEPESTSEVKAYNPELTQKVSSVNAKMIRAQRRLDEVNNRVKKLHDQYQALMQSLKVVEKEALLKQKERVQAQKEADKAAQQKKQNPYNYSAPDGGFYDQSVMDSYP